MRIAIIGCGAMGSIYAGLLSSTENEVIVISRNTAHINAINRNGLRITGASGDRTFQLKGFDHPPDEKVDLIIISVKGDQVESAAISAKGMIKPETIVLTIQNGLGSADKVASILGNHRLIVGVAQGFGAQLLSPGHTHHNDMKAIRMGAYSEISMEIVVMVAKLWRDAGFDAEPIENILSMQWEKLICNVAYSAIAALSGLTVGEILDDPELGPLSLIAAREAWEVALKLGVKIDIKDPEAHVIDFASRMRLAKPSVLLSIEAGQKSEIDLINGAIFREAAKIGMTAPVNQTLTHLVKSLENHAQSKT